MWQKRKAIKLVEAVPDFFTLCKCLQVINTLTAAHVNYRSRPVSIKAN